MRQGAFFLEKTTVFFLTIAGVVQQARRFKLGQPPYLTHECSFVETSFCSVFRKNPRVMGSCNSTNTPTEKQAHVQPNIDPKQIGRFTKLLPSFILDDLFISKT